MDVVVLWEVIFNVLRIGNRSSLCPGRRAPRARPDPPNDRFPTLKKVIKFYSHPKCSHDLGKRDRGKSVQGVDPADLGFGIRISVGARKFDLGEEFWVSCC